MDQIDIEKERKKKRKKETYQHINPLKIATNQNRELLDIHHRTIIKYPTITNLGGKRGF